LSASFELREQLLQRQVALLAASVGVTQTEEQHEWQAQAMFLVE